MQVAVLGINHKLADLKLREMLTKICLQRLSYELALQKSLSFVLLSTCNRTEIYFSSSDLAYAHSYLLNLLRCDVEGDFDQKLYTFFGVDCLIHLCRVAAGLDSAVLAETEIQGQVKTAYAAAHVTHKLPHELHYLFQKSLGIAKKARALLPLKPGMPDTEYAVFQACDHFFSSLQQKQFLFVGASHINEKIIAYFKLRKLKHLSLCNRTKSRGEQMAKKHQIAFLEWEKLELWQNFDAVICATHSPNYLIKLPSTDSFINKRLLIDLAVPRNIDPQLQLLRQLKLLNMDQINRLLQVRKKTLAHTLELAEELIRHASRQHHKLFFERTTQLILKEFSSAIA